MLLPYKGIGCGDLVRNQALECLAAFATTSCSVFMERIFMQNLSRSAILISGGGEMQAETIRINI